MKFLYYLSCIGNPEFNIKKNILYQNLIYIFYDLKCNFDIIINLYELDENYYNELTTLLESLNFITNKYIYVKKGVLSEVFLTNPYNKYIYNYDYILYILDDVKITNLNLNHMIQIKEQYELEIISPKIINSSHDKWNSLSGNILSINNYLEIYCFLMNPKNIKKFFSLHSIENKWGWGVDLIFGHLNIKVGTYYNCLVEHSLNSMSNQKEGIKCLVEYLGKHSLTIEDIRKKSYLIEKINLNF